MLDKVENQEVSPIVGVFRLKHALDAHAHDLNLSADGSELVENLNHVIGELNHFLGSLYGPSVYLDTYSIQNRGVKTPEMLAADMVEINDNLEAGEEELRVEHHTPDHGVKSGELKDKDDSSVFLEKALLDVAEPRQDLVEELHRDVPLQEVPVVNDTASMISSFFERDEPKKEVDVEVVSESNVDVGHVDLADVSAEASLLAEKDFVVPVKISDIGVVRALESEASGEVVINASDDELVEVDDEDIESSELVDEVVHAIDDVIVNDDDDVAEDALDDEDETTFPVDSEEDL